MRIFFGAALTTATLAAGVWFAWRLTLGIESWFATSGAGDAIMWSVVAAIILTVFALPAAAWGLAARAWVVRLEYHQRLEATHAVLFSDRPAQRHLAEPEHVELLEDAQVTRRLAD